MPWIETHALAPGESPKFAQQIYNGLDCALTSEILGAIKRHHNDIPIIYGFERALQAPALEMMLRGWKVDAYRRRKGTEQLHARIRDLDNTLQRFAFAVWGKGLNPKSTPQLCDFFYKTMGIKEIWISDKGRRRLAANREALEKIELHLYARPIVACILAIRELSKLLDVLQTDISGDGRMRTSYNIAGTETGRWSSSQSSDNTGTNLQNITGELRDMFIADDGYRLVGIDLEQAESREVGWLAGTLFSDWQYYDACLGGDLHTTTAKLIWPDLDWPGVPSADKELAEQPFYRHFSRRDMAKRGGHGSNYYGTPFTMARHLKVPVRLMEDFQRAYFGAFPGLPRWHRWVAQQLQQTQLLVTPFGRERHFFGRPNDDATLREAIAFSPQSSTADRMNLVLWRIWKYMGTEIQILGQVHDAVYFQCPESADVDSVLSRALALFDIPITHPSGRKLVVPGEAKIGWNWGNYSASNPEGLKKWKAGQPDGRKRAVGLDRVL